MSIFKDRFAKAFLNDHFTNGKPVTEKTLMDLMEGNHEVKIPSYTIPKTPPGKPATIELPEGRAIKITVNNPQGADLTNIEIKEFPPSVSFDHEGQHYEVPISGETPVTFGEDGVTIG